MVQKRPIMPIVLIIYYDYNHCNINRMFRPLPSGATTYFMRSCWSCPLMPMPAVTAAAAPPPFPPAPAVGPPLLRIGADGVPCVEGTPDAARPLLPKACTVACPPLISDTETVPGIVWLGRRTELAVGASAVGFGCCNVVGAAAIPLPPRPSKVCTPIPPIPSLNPAVLMASMPPMPPMAPKLPTPPAPSSGNTPNEPNPNPPMPWRLWSAAECWSWECGPCSGGVNMLPCWCMFVWGAPMPPRSDAGCCWKEVWGPDWNVAGGNRCTCAWRMYWFCCCCSCCWRCGAWGTIPGKPEKTAKKKGSKWIKTNNYRWGSCCCVCYRVEREREYVCMYMYVCVCVCVKCLLFFMIIKSNQNNHGTRQKKCKMCNGGCAISRPT